MTVVIKSLPLISLLDASFADLFVFQSVSLIGLGNSTRGGNSFGVTPAGHLLLNVSAQTYGSIGIEAPATHKLPHAIRKRLPVGRRMIDLDLCNLTQKQRSNAKKALQSMPNVDVKLSVPADLIDSIKIWISHYPSVELSISELPLFHQVDSSSVYNSIDVQNNIGPFLEQNINISGKEECITLLGMESSLVKWIQVASQKEETLDIIDATCMTNMDMLESSSLITPKTIEIVLSNIISKVSQAEKGAFISALITNHKEAPSSDGKRIRMTDWGHETALLALVVSDGKNGSTLLLSHRVAPSDGACY